MSKGTPLYLDDDAIVARYESGASARVIADEQSVSMESIYRVLRRNNVTMRNRGYLSPEERADIVRSKLRTPFDDGNEHVVCVGPPDVDPVVAKWCSNKWNS